MILKKTSLFIIFIIFLTGMAFAGEVPEAMRTKLTKHLVKLNKNNEGKELVINKLENTHIRNVERYEMYERVYHTGRKKKHYVGPVFLVVQDSIYAMPTEYNRYVRDRGETITEDNAFEKVEEFIKLWITVPVEIEKIRWKNLS